MLEWFGGAEYVLDILVALFGLMLLVGTSKITETNRGYRYLLPAFCCWLSLEVLLALEAGTLVSIPSPVGLIGGSLLLLGFLGLTARGLLAAWNTRKSADPLS